MKLDIYIYTVKRMMKPLSSSMAFWWHVLFFLESFIEAETAELALWQHEMLTWQVPCLKGRRAAMIKHHLCLIRTAHVYVNLIVSLWCAKKIQHYTASGKATWFCISSSICLLNDFLWLFYWRTMKAAGTNFSKAFNEVICSNESNIIVFCHSDAFLHAWPVKRSNKVRENHRWTA